MALDEAVAHRLREDLSAQFDKERAALNIALERREQQIAAEKIKIEERSKSVQVEIERQLETERRKLQIEAVKSVEEKLGVEMKDLQTQLTEQRQKLKTAQEAELELRKRQRELEEAKASMELEVSRKLDAERQKIADQARLQAQEAEHLKLADKENVIKSLQEQISALQQRAEQGSMQAQGETLELELESQLRSAFPFDEITEVKKGQRGGDATQRVRLNTGLDCGMILWEAKRAKNWSADWPEKLKDDQRNAKAEIAVIVTTCPPEGVRGIGQKDGVWICEMPYIIGLAAALRQGLVATATQRILQANRSDKMSAIYDHLCSVEFRQRIEAIVDSFVGLKDQLGSEQRAFAKQWKEREEQINKAILNTAMLYGGIQGIAGREALPEIRTLALPSGN
jgi:hypothetical protein